ncbi:hypothetical protein GF323_05035 [Candidatus Woesearchaeota archaeon]|nr:hypothetical protein [Candidatus Woesearchaeota archaeon]
MRRKVIKQGNNTLTITLPREWTSKHGINAGDELDIDKLDNTLVISGHGEFKEKKIQVDITGLDRTTILVLLQGLYRFGYDKIEIICDDNMVVHHRVGKKKNVSELIYEITNRFVGAEVVSASARRFVVKRIAEESMADFDTVLRRIFFLLNEMMDTFVDACKKGDLELMKTIEFKHVNIKKFINSCLRLLNKFGMPSPSKNCFYFNIISSISKAEDVIKNNSRYFVKYEMKSKTPMYFSLLGDIKEHVKMYYALFYKYDLRKIAKLNENRDLFRERLFKCRKDLSKDENILIGGLSVIVEMVLDMSETRMAMEE